MGPNGSLLQRLQIHFFLHFIYATHSLSFFFCLSLLSFSLMCDCLKVDALSRRLRDIAGGQAVLDPQHKVVARLAPGKADAAGQMARGEVAMHPHGGRQLIKRRSDKQLRVRMRPSEQKEKKKKKKRKSKSNKEVGREKEKRKKKKEGEKQPNQTKWSGGQRC